MKIYISLPISGKNVSVFKQYICLLQRCSKIFTWICMEICLTRPATLRTFLRAKASYAASISPTDNNNQDPKSRYE